MIWTKLFAAALIGTLGSVEAAQTIEIHLAGSQCCGWPDPNKVFCLVARKIQNKSTLKLAECNDLNQKETKIWEIDGEYLKLHSQPEYCIEAKKLKAGQPLLLGKCKRSANAKKKQKWSLPAIGGDHRIAPKKKENSLNVIYTGSGTKAKSGNDVILHPYIPEGRGEEGEENQVEWELHRFLIPKEEPDHCSLCADRYNVPPVFICKEKPNEYCEFYNHLKRGDYENVNNCKDYCEGHGGKCLKAYIHDSMCTYERNVSCTEPLDHGICRCSMPMDQECEDPEKCSPCDKKFDISSEDICKEKTNKYCQFHIKLGGSDCDYFCKRHGESCIKAFTDGDVKCKTYGEEPCTASMYDGICRCTMNEDCP